MNIAVVGSKRGMSKAVFTYWLDYYITKWGMPEYIITTGESGIAELAKNYAIQRNIRLKFFYADAFKDTAGLIERDNLIVKECTHCIAFPKKNSKITWYVIRKVSEMNKKLKIKQL